MSFEFFATNSDSCSTESSETDRWSEIEQEVKSIAENEVRNAIDQAAALINGDLRSEFFYANPQTEQRERTTKKYPDFLAFHAEFKEPVIHWLSIQEFSFNQIYTQIGEYISMWVLSPNTLFSLALQPKSQILPLKGTRYFITANFSKPTRQCPNPLAVAKAFFTISVPERLPKHYPVMVTYRFENYRSVFYAHGPKAIRSKDFQRFYIDSILHKKLNFYAQIFELRQELRKQKENAGESDSKNDEEICQTVERSEPEA